MKKATAAKAASSASVSATSIALPSPLAAPYNSRAPTPPPEIALADAGLSPAAQRFYAESKRVANARAKSELGWRPQYPTYREGLRAILAAERAS